MTGRPRRCGWFDAVAGRYSARVSGSTEIAVMLLDVLSGIDELKVAVAYEMNGRRVTELPASLADFDLCRPVYETLPGWSEDLTGVRPWSDLPATARNYVEFLAGQLGVPASIVSVGPDRRQTIIVPRRSTSVTTARGRGLASTSRTYGQDWFRNIDVDTSWKTSRRSPKKAWRGSAAAGLRPEQLPRHVAIIMDGNGRWAQRRGLPRIIGHRQGIQSVRAVVEEGCRLGLEQLTLYCLSVENWKRPAARADVPDAAAPPFPGRRAGRADGAERPGCG